MPGDLLNFLAVQAADCGFRSGPHVAAYSTNGGEDPENFSNDIPTGFENPALGFGWRAYDRAIRVKNDVDGVEFYCYQGNAVWELFDGSNWQSVISLAATQSTSQGSGVHTGLYHVTQADGTEHVCALYETSVGETGWVKFDPRTNTWTSGVVSGVGAGGNGIASGKCVPFKGKLYHPAPAGIQEFDPITESIRVYGEPAGVSFSVYAKLVVCQERLFLLTDEGVPTLLELAFGALVDHGPVATILPTSQVGKTAGADNFLSVIGPGENALFACWGQANGGSLQGLRAFFATVPTGSGQGSDVSFDEVAYTGTGLIPDGPGGMDTFSGFTHAASWLAEYLGLVGRGSSAGAFSDSLRDGAYQLEQFPAFTPASGNTSGDPDLTTPFQPQMVKYAFSGYFGDCAADILPGGVNGVARMELEPAPPANEGFWSFVHASGNHDVTRAFSQNTNQWGSVDRLFGYGPQVTNLRVEPYSDAIVSRGLRLTFQVMGGAAQLGDLGSDLYFGFGRRLERQGRRMTLNVGINPTDWPGGVATFDAPTNRLKRVPPGGFDRVTLYTVGGAGFVVGEIIEGQTSLARGTLAIRPGTFDSMYLTNLTGAFVDGETIEGLTSLATTTLTAPPERITTYQIIWDVDTDGIPEREWVTIQAAWFNGGNDSARCGMVSSADFQVQVLTEDTFPVDPPATTGGPVAESSTDTSASSLTTGGPSVEQIVNSSASPLMTGGPVAEQVTNTSQSPVTTGGPYTEQVTKTSETPITTGGPVGETTTDADLEGSLVRPVPGRPQVQGGGTIGVFDNDVDRGQRDGIDWIAPSGPVLPGYSFEGKSALPAGPQVRLRLDGVVELGRVSIDCVNDAVNSLHELLDVTAAGLNALQPTGDLPAGSVPGVGVLGVTAYASMVTGAGAQPSLSIGVAGPNYDSHAASQALALTATQQEQSMVLVPVKDLLRGGDVLVAELDAQSTFANYTIELVLYGFQRVSG